MIGAVVVGAVVIGTVVIGTVVIGAVVEGAVVAWLMGGAVSAALEEDERLSVVVRAGGADVSILGAEQEMQMPINKINAAKDRTKR